eukprot:747613-Hanusia_phi.AAC.2
MQSNSQDVVQLPIPPCHVSREESFCLRRVEEENLLHARSHEDSPQEKETGRGRLAARLLDQSSREEASAPCDRRHLIEGEQEWRVCLLQQVRGRSCLHAEHARPSHDDLVCHPCLQLRSSHDHQVAELLAQQLIQVRVVAAPPGVGGHPGEGGGYPQSSLVARADDVGSRDVQLGEDKLIRSQQSDKLRGRRRALLPSASQPTTSLEGIPRPQGRFAGEQEEEARGEDGTRRASVSWSKRKRIEVPRASKEAERILGGHTKVIGATAKKEEEESLKLHVKRIHEGKQEGTTVELHREGGYSKTCPAHHPPSSVHLLIGGDDGGGEWSRRHGWIVGDERSRSRGTLQDVADGEGEESGRKRRKIDYQLGPLTTRQTGSRAVAYH